jgi:hypothetical protein
MMVGVGGEYQGDGGGIDCWGVVADYAEYRKTVSSAY